MVSQDLKYAFQKLRQKRYWEQTRPADVLDEPCRALADWAVRTAEWEYFRSEAYRRYGEILGPAALEALSAFTIPLSSGGVLWIGCQPGKYWSTWTVQLMGRGACWKRRTRQGAARVVRQILLRNETAVIKSAAGYLVLDALIHSESGEALGPSRGEQP